MSEGSTTFEAKRSAFPEAYFLQKLAEFLFLSSCMGTQIYIGSRTSNPYDWGVFGHHTYGVLESFLGGVGVALTMYLVTLYPLIILILLAPFRLFILRPERRRLLLPAISTVLSVAYAVFWIIGTGFTMRLIPGGLIFAIVSVFIYFSCSISYRMADKS